MSITNVPLSDRGFLGGKFTDNSGRECSIQESSACSSNGDEGWYLWLGMDEPELVWDPCVQQGKFELPEGVLGFSRMNLSQKRVGELIPHLMYFAQTGSLPNAEEHAEFANFLGDVVQPSINDFFNGVST